MSAITVSSIAEIKDISSGLSEGFRQGRALDGAYVSEALFRGHADCDWPLATTLERFGKINLPIESYTRYLAAVKTAIESYTDRSFEFDYRNESTESPKFAISGVHFLKGQYEFMAYLRHHGFPSPLLDWSRSLYVALYFACSGGDPEKDAALYMFIENLGHGKGGMRGCPEIASLGQYVTTHKRHYIQQSEYTACVAEVDGKWIFHRHDMRLGEPASMQDRLEKFVIPASLKRGFLKELDSMNINAFSLFGTEEALMEMLARREME